MNLRKLGQEIALREAGLKVADFGSNLPPASMNRPEPVSAPAAQSPIIDEAKNYLLESGVEKLDSINSLDDLVRMLKNLR